MKKNLLLDFIEKSNTQVDMKILDYLQFDLNNKLYSFGNHFKNPNEVNHLTKNGIKYELINILLKIYVYFFSILKPSSKSKTILTSAYFNLEKKIELNQIKFARPPWVFNKSQHFFNYKLFSKSMSIRKRLNRGPFNYLLGREFSNLVSDYKSDFKSFVIENEICALFLPQDIGFFEKLAIDVFKDLNLPSFNFIHGLPGIYNGTDYNRTDYLVVWGEAIKRNFMQVGFDPNKIIVNGHPKYQIPSDSSLSFEFNDILVLSKCLNGSQYSEKLVLGDRSNLIYYLTLIKAALEKLGVKKVRLRPHPSENINWYYKFIDRNFFIHDSADLSESLSSASLVIGGISTVFLEALINKVNYVVFEPKINNILLDGFSPVAPFDGTEMKVPVAFSEIELDKILKEKKCVDVKILNDYIFGEFNFEKIANIITKGETRIPLNA